MAENAEVSLQPDGQVLVSGELAFSTVVGLLATSAPWFKSQNALMFDLGGVDKTDSAGLALLVEWMGLAKQHDKQIGFVHIPRQMMDIARVSGLDQLLPVGQPTS